MFTLLGPVYPQCSVVIQAEGSQCCFVSTPTPNKCLVSKRAISEVSELKKVVSILALVVAVEESSWSCFLITWPHFVVRTGINVSAEEALIGTLIAVISSRISYFLPVSPCSYLGLDHRALRSHPAGALWAEPVLHRTEAHRHRPVGAAAAGREPQLWWVHNHWAFSSWESAFYPHPVHTNFGEMMKMDSTHLCVLSDDDNVDAGYSR